jgi:RimJ/RimL family protein N-acetyltransferase
MTNALRLRALEPADCETLISWVDSADALTQWSGPWDFHWPLDHKQLLRDLRAGGRERLILAGCEPDGGLVAHGMLTLRRDHRIGLISRILVAPDRRSRGVGSSFVAELVRIGFDNERLHRLQLGVYDFTAPAIACYRRLGFVIEGTLRDSAQGSDGFWTSFVMALLEPDFRRARD